MPKGQEFTLQLCLAFLALVLQQTSQVAGSSQLPSTCGGTSGRQYVTIPVAMDLQDFKDLVIDKWLPEMYYVLPRPASYAPDYNFYSKFTLTSSTMREDSKGDFTSGGITTCALRTRTWDVVDQTHAAFLNSTGGSLQMYWSSCPDKYVWSMRCLEWRSGSSRCPLHAVETGLYVYSGLDDIPLGDAMSDFCQTGLQFGDLGMQWFFVHGENQKC